MMTVYEMDDYYYRNNMDDCLYDDVSKVVSMT